MTYQWYPGHMTRAIRMMRENVGLVDMIVELADARIPCSSRNPDIDALGKGKARLLVLNKADLADPLVSRLWLDGFRARQIAAMTFDAKKDSAKRIEAKAREVCADRLARDAARGLKNRPIRIMVAGIPNVGKSTFINRLAGSAKAKTGNKPGVTKGKQWIAIGNSLQLLDTPGLLWPRFENQTVGLHLALIGSMNDDNLDPAELGIDLIRLLQVSYPRTLEEAYRLTADQLAHWRRTQALPNDEAACLYAIAENRGFLQNGARTDYRRAAVLLLDDFRNGRLGRISLERPEKA